MQDDANPPTVPAHLRYKELCRHSKTTLVSMHIKNGGLMPRTTYMAWRKAELIDAVLRDEGYNELP